MGFSKTQVSFIILVAIIGITFGVIIGYFSGKTSQSDLVALTEKSHKSHSVLLRDDIIEEMMESYSAENIRNNLRELSAKPKLAGQARDVELAHYIRDMWLQSGLDSVDLVPYKILLSYPDPQKPNKVTLLSGQGEVLYETYHVEEVVRPEDSITPMVHSFSGYAPKGEVVGDLVYANYGRIEDFKKLEETGVVVRGTIVIARHGKIFRGYKVKNAFENGAIGVLLFSDPSDVAAEGTQPEDVYQHSWWLPATGMQRGTLLTEAGDPQTPGWPSLDGFYRLNVSKADTIPKIPCQPIGYQDAKILLQLMGGHSAPADWRAKLPNMHFRLGPGFNSKNVEKKVRLTVNNELKLVTSYNVIGQIVGATEPDRYILHGNHRDAWGYGALDPTSGTAVILETARIMGMMKQRGWRPHRTLVFCSWGAEEYGIIGSTEWVEDYLPLLMSRAVSYINSDSCSRGDTFRVWATPTMVDVIYEATKKVRDPHNPHKTVYDVWKERENEKTGSNEDPVPPPVTGRSDQRSFIFKAGIPSVDLDFTFKKRYTIGAYPAYHTAYDTFYSVDKYVDPGFVYHRACGQILSFILTRLTDSVLIPLDLRRYGPALKNALDKHVSAGYGEQLQQGGISLDPLYEAVENFSKAADDWHKRLETLDLKNQLAVRMINDQIMAFDRVFILPEGLPGRPLTRHAMFSPSKFNHYAGVGFPGIPDLLHRLEDLSVEEQGRRWEEIEKHVTLLRVLLRQATYSVSPVNRLHML